MKDRVLALLNNNPSWVDRFRFSETKFSEGDVDDFLAGHTNNHTDDYDYATDRPLHIRQVISYIGSTIDDADGDTYTNYKALWRVRSTTNCDYCGKDYSVRLMMIPRGKACCGSTRCAMQNLSR